MVSKEALYIFCGKMASGKSTLAKQIAENNSLFLMSENALLGALYPLLTERSVKEPERHATDTTEMFEAITRHFEPPPSDDGLEIVIHEREWADQVLRNDRTNCFAPYPALDSTCTSCTSALVESGRVFAR